MPTDIPALIERLNRKCDLASVGDRCELAFPDKHSTCGPVEWCAACDAAAALAEQAAEIKRLRAGHDEVLESLREIMGAVSWFVSQPERWEAAKARARQWLASTEGTTRDSTTDTPEPDNA